MNLLESYKGRLSISEKLYAQKNDGAKMGNQRKMVTAQCLDNVARFMNEAFQMSAGTQRADLGTFKKFCLDITAITVPNMIVNDLFIVQPMSSFSGYLTYMEFGLGEPKGGVGGVDENGDFITVTQNPFVYEPMTAARSAYTSAAVVEAVEAGEFVPAWGPVQGDVEITYDNGVTWAKVEADSEGKFIAEAAGKIRYHYDNQVIPQEKLPTLVGHMKGIALQAKARRIAINYSQFAAFQS